MSLIRKLIEDPNYFPGTLTEKLLAGLLSLASFFYRLGVELRNEAFRLGLRRIKKLLRPVISVGNITVGGTGKTPVTAWLARYFLAKGLRPCILSRGYGRENENEILLIEGGKGPYNYKKKGDEPAFLAAKLPGAVIALGADRYLAAQAALEKYPLDLFILDDGFQHQQLARDLNILLLDSNSPWGNGRLFPRGSLREPKGNIRRADMILLTKAQRENDYEELKAEAGFWNPKAPVLTAGYKSRALYQIDGSLEITPDKLYDKNILAFAGIARPQSFQQTLNSLGAKVIKFISYPDHYVFNEKDLSDITKTAENLEVDFIVTTEKDAVRLMGKELTLPFWALEVEVEFFEDKQILEVLLKNLLVNEDEE